MLFGSRRAAGFGAAAGDDGGCDGFKCVAHIKQNRRCILHTHLLIHRHNQKIGIDLLESLKRRRLGERASTHAHGCLRRGPRAKRSCPPPQRSGSHACTPIFVAADRMEQAPRSGRSAALLLF